MADAAVKAGAPRGLISCLSNVTLEATGELMRHPDVALVMATGGPGMVRAAYSSGKPTLAVGAGNVPVYIHRSVKDVREAALMAITSKSFDNGTACVAEQSIVLDEPIADAALAAFAAQGTLFLSPEDQERLGRIIFAERGEFEPEAVGLSAKELARRTGVAVPPDCKVLGARAFGGRSEVSALARNSGPGPLLLSHGRPRCRLRALPRDSGVRWRRTHARPPLRSRIEVIGTFSALPAAASSSIRRPCSAAWALAARQIHRSCWAREPGAARSSPTM